jgi:hypothetical protein
MPVPRSNARERKCGGWKKLQDVDAIHESRYKMHCFQIKEMLGNGIENFYAGSIDRKAYCKQLPSGPAPDKARMAVMKKTLSLPILFA